PPESSKNTPPVFSAPNPPIFTRTDAPGGPESGEITIQPGYGIRQVAPSQTQVSPTVSPEMPPNRTTPPAWESSAMAAHCRLEGHDDGARWLQVDPSQVHVSDRTV